MKKKRYVKEFRQEEIDAMNTLISAAGIRKRALEGQNDVSCEEHAEYHLIDNAQETVIEMLKEAGV